MSRTDKIDVVYPLGIGSAWQDNEIRYSIRAFDRFFSYLGKIFIVGHKPDFLNWGNPRLIHISAEDIYKRNKDGNLIRKTLLACDRDDLSGVFIRCSDDQMPVRPVQIADFQARYLEYFSKKTDYNFDKSRWRMRLGRTVEYLKKNGYPTYHYDSHYPMLYTKKSFKMIMNYKIFDGDGDGSYTINTFYFNQILSNHKELGKLKLTLEQPVFKINELKGMVAGAKFLGYKNKSLKTGVLKEFIENLFPEKTNFEL